MSGLFYRNEMITAIVSIKRHLHKSDIFTAVKVASNPRREMLPSVRKLNQSEETVNMTPRGVDKSPVRCTNNGLEAEGPS